MLQNTFIPKEILEFRVNANLPNSGLPDTTTYWKGMPVGHKFTWTDDVLPPLGCLPAAPHQPCLKARNPLRSW